jgi:hypothetical protein
MLHPTGLWVAGLLERGVRALIYVGEHDWICNHVGNARWVAALDWSGHAAYAGADERVWEVDGAGAGRVRSAGPLTFATIRKAGHMVRAALAVGSGWTDASTGPVRQAEGEPRDGAPLDQGRGVLSARVRPTLSQPSARQARHVRHVLLPTVSCATKIHCYSARALRLCLSNSLFGLIWRLVRWASTLGEAISASTSKLLASERRRQMCEAYLGEVDGDLGGD